MAKSLQPWGKTDQDTRPSHHLAHHCMDVAAVFEGLTAHPVISIRLDRAAGRALEDHEKHWLAAFAFLHDIGKISPAFQAKAWPELSNLRQRSHLIEGWAWIESFVLRQDALRGVAQQLLGPLTKAPEGVDVQWLTALFAHHGKPSERSPIASFKTLSVYNWQSAEDDLGDSLKRWFNVSGIGIDVLSSAPLVHLFAGLLTLADWIGSDTQCFPHQLKLDIDDYANRARKQAAEALERFGLVNPQWPSSPPDFVQLTGYPQPRGVQALIDDIPMDTPLSIIEAETGSGKTEAALWHFSRLRSAGLVDALYFAVPTRAAASQLHRRVHEAMVRIGGPDAVLAVPGQLIAGESEGVRLPGFEVRWDDGKIHWAAEQASRFLAAPIAVGTVDQALLAGLMVKHAHLRGAAMSRSLLVIDEVHASDSYMNRVARGLVEDHTTLGGYTLLMSATLGASQRQRWLNQPETSLAKAIKTPYPVVWRSDTVKPLALKHTDASHDDKEVWPELHRTMCPEYAVGLAIEAARKGARVLIIRNTVRTAVATWQALLSQAPEHCLSVAGHPALHHSRFSAEDRRQLDKAVEAVLGKSSMAKGVVVIGTQTLEQSLDIDADLLITDLCPMDVLLQRIGRLYRHLRTRPAEYAKAIVYVLSPADGLDRLAKTPAFENGLGAWEAKGSLEGVYTDLRIIEGTKRLVENESAWSIPQDNRRLVETATHPDSLNEIEQEMGWQEYSSRIDAGHIAESQQGALRSLSRSKPIPEQFPSNDEHIQSRLGARGPVLTFPTGTQGPFGQEISTITPPAHWCFGLTGEEEMHVTNTNDGLAIEVGEKRFLYQRSGLSVNK